MHIKSNALPQALQKKIAPIYVLIGQDNYLLEEACCAIQSAVRKAHAVDEKSLSLAGVDQWHGMVADANSYSLFGDLVLINACYEKKTLAQAEKKILMDYAHAVNTLTCLVIRAPNLPIKQWQWASALAELVVVQVQPLQPQGMKQWIVAQLASQGLQYAPQVPDLVYQYTQGNMLACAQLIEKLALCHAPGTVVSAEAAMEQVSYQWDHSPFELIDACLLGRADHAVQILRHAAHTKAEPTLLLWMLTQEVRTLLHLAGPQPSAPAQAVWPKRMPWYQATVKRHQYSGLIALLQYCQVIDERIKSEASHQAWHALERLAIALSTGVHTQGLETAW